MDPGGHGIFDFIHRDPKTYFPDLLGLARRGRDQDDLGSATCVLPISKAARSATPAQGPGLLADPRGARHPGHRSSRCRPTTRRPRRSSGRSPAWGRPTSSATYGIFNYYTTEATEREPGHRRSARSTRSTSSATGWRPSCPGPINSFKKERAGPERPFKVFLDPSNAVAKIVLHGPGVHPARRRSGAAGSTSASRSSRPRACRGICTVLPQGGPAAVQALRVAGQHRPGLPALPISTPAGYAEGAGSSHSARSSPRACRPTRAPWTTASWTRRSS